MYYIVKKTEKTKMKDNITK